MTFSPSSPLYKIALMPMATQSAGLLLGGRRIRPNGGADSRNGGADSRNGGDGLPEWGSGLSEWGSGLPEWGPLGV